MRLIDADALIANNQYDDWVDWNDKAVFEHIVEEQPTVDAEPVKHGRWIKKEDLFGEIFYRCSACREPMNNWYDYCPNCGAKMDLEG